MSPDVDDDLRRLFAESADSIEGLPHDFDAMVLSAGSKRRRTRLATIGAGAAALALVAVAAVWQGPSLIDRATPPTSNDETPTKMTTDAWVASLPRGGDLQAAYADGIRLHVGDSEVMINGDEIHESSQIELLGKVTDGWLARRGELRESPGGLDLHGRGRRIRRHVHGAHSPAQGIPASCSQARWHDVRLRTAGAQRRHRRSVATDPGRPLCCDVARQQPPHPTAGRICRRGCPLALGSERSGVPPTEVVFPESSGRGSSGALTPGGVVAVNHAGCTELYDMA